MESEPSFSGDGESSSGSGSSESSSESEEEERIEPIRVLGQTLELPQDLCENSAIFKEFFSLDTWNSLEESQKEHLKKFLPSFPENDDEEKEKTIQALFTRKKFKFTSPLMDFHDNLKLGNYRPDIVKMKTYLQKTQEKQNKQKMRKYYAHLMLDVVIERERLLAAAKGLPPGPLPRLPSLKEDERKIHLTPHERTKIRYFQELTAVQTEVNAADVISEDENYPEEVALLKGNKQRKHLLMQSEPSLGNMLLPLTADSLKSLLANHRARRNRRENHPELNTMGITLEDVKKRVGLHNGAAKSSLKLKRKRKEKVKKKLSSVKVAIKSEIAADDRGFNVKCNPVKIKSEKDSDSDTLIDPTGGSPVSGKLFKSNSVDNVDIKEEILNHTTPVQPIENERVKSPPTPQIKREPVKLEPGFNQSVPIKLEDLDGIDMMSLPVELEEQHSDEACLETETHANFFSLVRALFPPSQAHRADLLYLRRKLSATLRSPIAPLNSWYSLSTDWSAELDSALAFLAGEKGPHPEDYVPYLQFITETQMYQWIGAGRDCDALLGRLCERWLRSKRSPQKPDVPPAPNEPQTPTPPKEQKKTPIIQKEPSRLQKTFQKLQKEFKKTIIHKEPPKKKERLQKEQIKEKTEASSIPAHWEQAINSFKIMKKDEKPPLKEQLSFTSFREESPFSVGPNVDLSPNFTTVKKDSVSSSDSGTDVRIPAVKTKIVAGKPLKGKPLPKNPANKANSRKPSKEVQEFREAEKCRYAQPDVPYTYNTKFGSVVVPPLQFGCLSTLDTTNWDTLLECELAAKLVVCDALARSQPKGATQHQLIMLVKMSQYVKKVPDQNLLQYVLHILEQMKSNQFCPMVKHDSRSKLWTYLLRDKTEHDFLLPTKASSVDRETEHMEVGCVEEIIGHNDSSDSEVDVENTSESSPPILRPDEQKMKMSFISAENLFTPTEEANQEYATKTSDVETILSSEPITHQAPQKSNVQQVVNITKANSPSIVSESNITQILNRPRAASPQTTKVQPKQIIFQPMTLQSHHIINRTPNVDQTKHPQTSVTKIVTQPQFVQSSVQQIVQPGQRVLKVVQSSQPSSQTQSLLQASQYLGRSPIIVAAPKTTTTVQNKGAQIKNAVKIPILHSLNSQMLQTEQLSKEKSPSRTVTNETVQRPAQHQLILQTSTGQTPVHGRKIMPTQQLLIKTAGQGQKLQQISLQGQKILHKTKPSIVSVPPKTSQPTLKTVTIQKPNQNTSGNQLILTSMGGQKILQSSNSGQAVSQIVGQQIMQNQAASGQQVNIQLPQVVQTTQNVNSTQIQAKNQGTRSLLLRQSSASSGDSNTSPNIISTAQGRRGVVRVLSAATPASGKSLISPRALLQQGNQAGIKKQAPNTSVQSSTTTPGSIAVENRPKTVQFLQTTGQRRTIQLAGQSVQLPSGQTVQLATGQNLQTIQLGQNVQLAGQTVHIGGQNVQLTGQTVQIGGQNVQLASGQRLQLGGQTVQLASGQSVQLSGQTVQLASGQSVQLASPIRTNAQTESTTGVSATSGAQNKPLLLTHKNIVLQPGDAQHALILSNLGGSPQIVRTSTSNSPPIIKLQQVSSLQHMKLAQGIKLQQAGAGGNMVTLTSPQLKLLGSPGHILARILPTSSHNKPPSTEPS